MKAEPSSKSSSWSTPQNPRRKLEPCAKRVEDAINLGGATEVSHVRHQRVAAAHQNEWR